MSTTNIDTGMIQVFLWIGSFINKLSDCWKNIYLGNRIIRDSSDSISYTTMYIYNTLLQKRIEPKEKKWWSITRINGNILEEEYIYEKPLLVVKPALLIYHTPSFILCTNSGIIDEGNVPAFSSIRFLSVEYTHPDMAEPIQLTLEKEWCIAGNEILGDIHILRLLEYEYIKSEYIFDDRYVVNVIDSNICVFNICRGQFIRMEYDDYQVIMV
jgi:hypothetical protein